MNAHWLFGAKPGPRAPIYFFDAEKARHGAVSPALLYHSESPRKYSIDPVLLVITSLPSSRVHPEWDEWASAGIRWAEAMMPAALHWRQISGIPELLALNPKAIGEMAAAGRDEEACADARRELSRTFNIWYAEAHDWKVEDGQKKWPTIAEQYASMAGEVVRNDSDVDRIRKKLGGAGKQAPKVK